jgi:hypothetical protein
MMMNSKLFFALMVVFSVSLFARFPEANSYDANNPQRTSSQNIGFTGQYPYDKRKLSTPPSVQKERFELNLNKNIVEDLQKKVKRKQSLLDGTLDIAVIQKPIYRAMKTIDTLYLHSNFITTIMFPKNIVIKTAGASFSTNEFSFSQNILLLQPTNNARNGNIVFSLSDGKRNYMMTIFVKQYFGKEKCKVENGNYKCADDYLATIIKYIQSKKLTVDFQLQLLEDYLKLNKLKKLTIPNNLGYKVLQKGKETYYIIRDDEFGTIFKSGLSLTIKNSIN